MKISILIPCWNEEKLIYACLQSCLNQTRKADEIIVVNDGSTDKSLEILQSFGSKIKIVNLAVCGGNKSYAQEAGLKHVKGDVFICSDADTLLEKNFVQRIALHFKNPKTVAVSGYVQSLKYNWLTACRQIDYSVGQEIHKLAQSYISFLMVIPGAAGAFRTNFFKKHISFDHDTVTEDLDFTYKINKKGLKIEYDKKAIAYTQDPSDLTSYIKQMQKWYGGGWQNLKKHYQIIARPACALELSLNYIEGLVFAILFFLMPLLNIKYFGYFIIFYLIIALISSIYAAIISKRIELIIYFPLYFVVMIINAYIFLQQFLVEFVLGKKNLVWFKPKRRILS